MGIILGVAAYWFGWSVPGIEVLAPVDAIFTRMKHRVGGRLPQTPGSWRQRTQRPTVLVSAPTRKDIRDELDRLGVSGTVSQEQFVEALYRAYVDEQGRGLR